MTTRSAAAAVVACLVVTTGATAGARDRAPSLADIRHTFESSSPSCRLDVEEELILGRTKLWFVRRLVGMVDDVDPQSRALLDGLRRIEVGSYRVRDDADGCPAPRGFEADLMECGWIRTARWQDESGWGIILQRVDADDRIDGMLVLDVSANTVEIVRLEGRIQDVLAAAVRADPASTGRLLTVN